jgi:succinate dehydrogenase hydrophobic anchor subunit
METHVRVAAWLRIGWSLVGVLLCLYGVWFFQTLGAPMVRQIIHSVGDRSAATPGAVSLGAPGAPADRGASDAAVLEQVTAEVMTVLTVLCVVLALFQGVAAYTGWALLAYRPWARSLNIVLSIFDLFAIPIGTAIGGYSLWVMFKPATVELFERKPPTERYPAHF